MEIFNSFRGIDIDHCLKNGVLSEMAMDMVEIMDSYTEISPSGTGLHIIFKAPGFQYDVGKYYINNRKIGLEAYVYGATNRFLSVTGNVFRDSQAAERGKELQIVLEKYMVRPQSAKKAPDNAHAGISYLSDESVVTKAGAAKDGTLFKKLWNGDISSYASQSGADMALASMLSF